MSEPDYESLRKAWIDIGAQGETDPMWVLHESIERGKSFDYFLVERHKKAVLAGVKAERLRILGLLEDGWTMNKIWMGEDDE
jgi:hypothetical protein